MDTCSSVEDFHRAALKIRLVGDGAPTSHFLVVDADGDSAGIEYIEGRLVVYTGEDLPIKAMSNMEYARTLEAYKRGGPRWWWSNPGRSAERFAGAADRMANYDHKKTPNAMGYALETLAYVVSVPWTKWSVVYNIAKREVWFGSVVSPEVKSLSLHAFDFTCKASTLMLDVNTPTRGNAESRFLPYDRDINLKVFQTLCERYHLGISQEDALAFMQLIDSFKCAR